MLHEYVSFALFSAGAALGSGAEGELAKQVGSGFRNLGVSSRGELAARGILPARERDDPERD